MPRAFLTTATHFEHFLGPRCRTGARPELGPSLVPNRPLQGAPRTTQGSPREPPSGPKGHPFGPSLVLVWSQIRLIQVPIELPPQVPILVPFRFPFRFSFRFPSWFPFRFPSWFAPKCPFRFPFRFPLTTTVRVLCWDNFLGSNRSREKGY